MENLLPRIKERHHAHFTTILHTYPRLLNAATTPMSAPIDSACVSQGAAYTMNVKRHSWNNSVHVSIAHTLPRLAAATAIIASFGTPLRAEQSAPYRVDVELGPVWQSKNEVRIPNDEGDKFSISDFSEGPFPSGRISGEFTFAERHTVQAVFAPLIVHADGTLDHPTRFQDTTFDGDVSSKYRFNSYRLGYRYLVLGDDPWKLQLGGALKIRDASVSLTQGDITERDSNIGLVPLLSAQCEYSITPRLSALLDIEGLGAPQGRAIDALVAIRYDISDSVDLSLGYRTLEGGADNDSVYSFSWFHYAVAGIGVRF
jgi:hypothetical protein